MAKRNCFFPVILELPLLLYRNKYHENALVGFKCQTSKRFESRVFVWLLNQTPLLLPGFSFEVTLGELHYHP